MPVFPSADWVAAWVQIANTNRELSASTAHWDGALGFVISVDSGGTESQDMYMRVATRGGKWSEGAVDTKESLIGDAVFSLRGPYSEWRRVIRGELDPWVALVQGGILFQGDLPVNMGKWLTAFGEVTTQVDTEFITEPLPPRDSQETLSELQTCYAQSGSLSIAYGVLGEGPIDLLMVPGIVSHIDYMWSEHSLARFLRKLSSFSRTIIYDKRGMGLSDRDPQCDAPSLQDRVDDTDAVMRAAGSKRVVLCGYSEGGLSSLLFTATHPERVSALILVSTTPRFTVAPGFPEGVPESTMQSVFEGFQKGWGKGVGLELVAPSVAKEPRFQRWWAAYQRAVCTPNTLSALLSTCLTDDVRHVLPFIQVPTLILHHTNDLLIPVACGRYMAQRIPTARYVELTGSDHLFWLGDQNSKLKIINDFIAELPSDRPAHTPRSRRRRPRSGWDSLTEAELDVARLVTEGLTNREIGQRLYVSPRTVQTHLAHIFNKLSLSRRSELSASAAEHLR